MRRRFLISLMLALCIVLSVMVPVLVSAAGNTYPNLVGTLSGNVMVPTRNFDGSLASSSYRVTHVDVVVDNQTSQFVWGANYTLPGATVYLWRTGQTPYNGTAWYTVGAFGVVGNKTVNNPRPYVTFNGYNLSSNTSLVAAALWGRVRLGSDGNVTRFFGKLVMQVVNTTAFLYAEGTAQLAFTLPT